MAQVKIRIKTNAEGGKAIQELLDIALKQGGLQSMNGVAQIMNSIEVDEEYFANLDKEAEKEEAKAKK